MRKNPVFARKVAKNLGKRCVFRGFCRGQHFYPRNMVRTKGLAPLRRAPVNSPPGCSVCSRAFCFLSSFRKPLALARASPLKSLRSSISYQKRDGATAPSLFWCGRRDLNPHGLPQEPETCASANFATSAYEDSQKTVFLSSPEEASKRKIFPPADILFTGSPLCISRAALFSNPQAHHLLYSTISSKSSVLSS